MIQAVVLLVGALVGISLIVGAILGLVVAIWAQDTAAAVRIIVNGYYALVGLLPIVLWLTIYDSPLRSLLTTVQGAAVGSILGAGPVFLTLVINLPVVLADFDIVGFGPAVRNEIVWSRLLLAVGAAVLGAIPLGLWAYYTGPGREAD